MGFEPTRYKAMASKATMSPIPSYRHIVHPKGVEPSRLKGPWILSPVRLPIPPRVQIKKDRLQITICLYILSIAFNI